MRRKPVLRTALRVIFVFLGTGSFLSLWAQTDRIVAVRAGRLFDPKLDNLLTNQVVLIRGERITDVGPASSVTIPPNANIIDLSQATVLPGLIDLHVHLENGEDRDKWTAQFFTLWSLHNAQKVLNNGFTAMVDLGHNSALWGTADVRNVINRGLFVGPRMQVALLGIATTNGHGLIMNLNSLRNSSGEQVSMAGPTMNPENTIFADSPWAARQAVREIAKHGSDWIKIYGSHQLYYKPDGTMVVIPTFTLEEMKALVDETHRNVMKVACHVHGGEGLHNCIEAGVDAVLHGGDVDDEAARMLVQKNIPLVPSVTGEPDEADLKTTDGLNSRHRMIEKGFKKALAAGVRMGFGGGISNDPGRQFGEFRGLIKNGMTPLHALRTATANSAEILGWQDRIGSVTKGKFADLIAVPGNPLTDITEMSRVRFVMKGGQVVRNDLK